MESRRNKFIEIISNAYQRTIKYIASALPNFAIKKTRTYSELKELKKREYNELLEKEKGLEEKMNKKDLRLARYKQAIKAASRTLRDFYTNSIEAEKIIEEETERRTEESRLEWRASIRDLESNYQRMFERCEQRTVEAETQTKYLKAAVQEAKTNKMVEIFKILEQTVPKFNQMNLLYMNGAMQPVYATKGFMKIFNIPEGKLGEKISMLPIQLNKDAAMPTDLDISFEDKKYALRVVQRPIEEREERIGTIIEFNYRGKNPIRVFTETRNIRSVNALLEEIIEQLGEKRTEELA